MCLVSHDSQLRRGTGAASCLSNSGSSHDDRHHSILATLTVSRVQVEEVGVVGQRLGLEPNRADVLPASKVILVPFAPGRRAVDPRGLSSDYRQFVDLREGP